MCFVLIERYLSSCLGSVCVNERSGNIRLGVFLEIGS
jgi:hypothetical protein